MNIRELEYLVAVDEERHLHKAAARCFVSQPTLSGQLKKLEQELGVLLIERSNRRVDMTEVGKEVVAHARSVLAGIKDIQTICPDIPRPYDGGPARRYYSNHCSLSVTHHHAGIK